MNIKVFDDKPSLGQAAAQQAAEAIRRAIQKNGTGPNYCCDRRLPV